MSGAAQLDERRWVVSVRAIPGEIDRAKLRTTLTYQFHPRFSGGLEYNPLETDVGVLANLLLITETDSRPALILGTSSDRIGTDSGRAVYATFSKDLRKHTGLPLAPYLGVSYGGSDREFRPIAGLRGELPFELRAMVMFDGVNVHPALEYDYDRHTFGFLLADGTQPGLSWSVRF